VTQPASAGIRRFTLLYFLANIGLFTAFVPVLTLLLPERIAKLAPGHEIVALSWILLVGAAIASIANIIAGFCSDFSQRRFASRYPVMALGLAGTLCSYGLLGSATNLQQLGIGLAIFQIALNFLFSPLATLMADRVPHQLKGMVAGLVALCLPAASISVSLLALLPGDAQGPRYLLLGLTLAVLVMPLMVFDRPPAKSALGDQIVAAASDSGRFAMRDFLLAWTARLLVQFAGATLFGYSYLYIAGLEQNGAPATLAAIRFSVSMFALAASAGSIISGLAAGMLSDRIGRRLPFLIGAAGLVGVATVTLAITADWWLALTAYALFSVGLTAFLTVETAMVAQIVSNHDRPATILGIMNLTNTIPAALVPVFSLVLQTSAPTIDTISWLLFLSTFGATAAAITVSRIRSVR
jgi:MFS family permease